MKIKLDERYTFSGENNVYFCGEYIGNGCNEYYAKLMAMIHRAKFLLEISGYSEVLYNKNHDIALYVNPNTCYAVRYGCQVTEHDSLELAGKEFDNCLKHSMECNQ